ncbi:MAG: collagen-like protein [Ruminococcus sp.]|nr:collagen-like protein [Ruminococcus sp.]
MWKLLVKQQKIEILEREVIADKQISFVNLKFIFDGDWKKFHKVVQFTQCDETYNRVLGTDGTSCLLPSELHAGAVRMSVFGYDAENTNGLRATTVPVTLNVRPSGFVGDGAEEVPPTPDLYAQLLQKIDEKAESIQNGADGLSAYEIARENGFSGTETEWLASLKGDRGDTGLQGIQGEKGDKGDTGEQGEKGDTGDTGAKGSKGDTGADGKSAYDVWLEQGNSGTETDFLNSLKGEKGDKGDTGSASVEIEAIEEQLAELTNQDARWGNFNPVGRAEYPNACDTYYVPTGQKRTFAVIPRIADIENNALNNSPAGMFVVDFSENIRTLENSAHTHTNKEFLDSIETTLNSRFSVLSASLSAVDDEHGRHINSLEEASHTHTNKEFLDGIETTLNSRFSVMSASLSAVDDEHGRQINSLEETSHTHTNKDFLDTLSEQYLSETYVSRVVYNRDLNDLHENIQGEHTTFRTEISELKTEIGSIKTVLADIVEVTE